MKLLVFVTVLLVVFLNEGVFPYRIQTNVYKKMLRNLKKTCENGKYLCKFGTNYTSCKIKCIRPDQLCDKNDDCPEKDDEANCPTTCPEGSIRCRSGKCAISCNKNMECNGDLDKGEDEQNCGTLATWSEWSGCSKSEGVGLRTRTKQCSKLFCEEGTNSESEVCGSPNCPAIGVWGTWTQFSECTVTCGGGIMSRTRVCSEPLCPADSTIETTDCNTQPCICPEPPKLFLCDDGATRAVACDRNAECPRGPAADENRGMCRHCTINGNCCETDSNGCYCPPEIAACG